MKTETEIAKELELGNPNDVFTDEIHKETCERWLEFLEDLYKSKILKIKQIVSYGESCVFLTRCGLDLVMRNKYACLFNVL